MSQPNFPTIDPPLTRDGSVNEIIASIAAEELSLSHILNAEGEKLQYVLGTLPGLSGGTGVQDVLDVNRSVQQTLDEITQQQLLLGAKLSAALDAPVFTGPTGATGPNGPNPTATAGFAANTAGTSLTVATAGRYRISYHVNTTAALLMGSRLVINGGNNTASTIAPVLSVSSYENEIEVNLPANSTITLQLYPIALAGVAVLRSGGAGASLMIIRLS